MTLTLSTIGALIVFAALWKVFSSRPAVGDTSRRSRKAHPNSQSLKASAALSQSNHDAEVGQS